MPNENPNDEKEALVQGYVEGLLTPEESARLHDMVRKDPMLARVLLENMRMDGAIRDIVGEREKGTPALVPPPPGAPETRGAASDSASSTARLARITRSKDTRRFGSERSNRIFVGLAAAAGLLIAIGITIVGTSGPTDKEREARRVEEARRDLERRTFEAQQRLAVIKAAEKAHQQRLMEISTQRDLLSRPPVQAAPDPSAEESRQKEIARLDAERERIERDRLAEMQKEEKVREELAVDPPEDPVKPLPAPLPGPTTLPSIAKVDSIAGEVHALIEGKRKLIEGSHDLLSGQGLETTGANGRAALIFGDKTRVEVGAETVLSEIKVEGGKRILFDRGDVRADVSRQPKGKAMVFVTPQAEVKVVGTSLRIIVVPGDAGRTHLEVTEGKVQLKRRSDGKTVDVMSGQFAVASAGAEPLVTKPLPRTLAQMLLDDHGVVKINFGPDGIPLPDRMMLNDSAKKFDPAKGYGWVEGPPAVWAGISPTPSDPIYATYVAGGTLDKTATWKMAIRNGRYQVAVCVGGVGAVFAEQGPHHVVVEGKAVFDTSFTRNGAFVEHSATVAVQDGELTMEIGGSRGKLKSGDNSDDTILIYIVIRKAS